VEFFVTLWREAQQSYTPLVLLLALVSFVLTRWVAIDKPRFKAMFFFVAAHLICLIATAAFETVGSTELAAMLRTPTWIFEAASLVASSASLLFAVVLPRMRLHTPLIVQDVIVAIAMVASTLGVLSRAGVNLSGLIATSAVFTAILGFSLQDVIGNVAGGLALQVDNSVEEGDWIKVGDVTGRVVEIRWRHTAVETRNWDTVLIPNTVMTKSNVAIIGRRRGQATMQRRWVYFNVDWRHQPGDVINVVQTAVRGAHLQHVAREPQPNVVLMDMTDTFGKYAVRYWLTELAVDDPTDSSVRACIYFALQRAGMSLALPAHAIFVTEETTDRKAIKTEKQVQRRRDLLARLELFNSLSEAERDELARHMRYAPFARGEVMTRQGAEAHWLYLVEDGEAAVRISDGVHEREVARLNGPCFFGEMSLLTGEPRSATVVAEGEVECFRLDKVAVQHLIEKRPALAEQLATLLAERQVKLQSVKEGLTADVARERAKREANALLTRIRSFFAID
jgi:small-conductance mechanosensitive channel/CRP-like cAMP-binding protein